MKMSFLGAAGTVTGSKYLVETSTKKILVDCGLFQGRKDLRLRNWADFPIDASTIDAVVLTHAHLDHSGYLPLLVRHGFEGPVYCTSATLDLCKILLPDSGYLMEAGARYANRKGFSKHHPAKPLYTKKEAITSLKSFRAVDYETDMDISRDLRFRLDQSGHILGSAFVTLRHHEIRLVFSGDLGRIDSPTMPTPAKLHKATHLVVESTYGNRLHSAEDVEDQLADAISRAAAQGGSVIVPAFAVGRAQALLYHIGRLMDTQRIPNMPVFLDSPMAINASELFCKHVAIHRLSEEQCRSTCNVARYVNSPEDSKALDRGDMPIILISASGMATGGRILHHLKHFAPDRKNMILFTGFQASGTRGDRIVKGEKRVKIHGQMIPVEAEVVSIDGLSAHADQQEIIDWVSGFQDGLQQVFVTHGSADSSTVLAEELHKRLGVNCSVPSLDDTVELN